LLPGILWSSHLLDGFGDPSIGIIPPLPYRSRDDHTILLVMPLYMQESPKVLGLAVSGCEFAFPSFPSWLEPSIQAGKRRIFLSALHLIFVVSARYQSRQPRWALSQSPSSGHSCLLKSHDIPLVGSLGHRTATFLHTEFRPRRMSIQIEIVLCGKVSVLFPTGTIEPRLFWQPGGELAIVALRACRKALLAGVDCADQHRLFSGRRALVKL